MTTSGRLTAASVAAFGLAFAVVLALGQALPSGSTGGSSPSASGVPTSATEPMPTETPPTDTTPTDTTPTETTPSETAPSETTPPSGSEPPGTDAPTTAGPRSVDLRPWLDGEPPTGAEIDELDPLLRELNPKVWAEKDDRVHVCVQVPDGWQIVADWTAVEGPIHCTSARSGEPIELELVRS